MAVALVLLLVAGVVVLVWAVVDTGQKRDASRRWARVAQRRAPVRGGSAGGYDGLLDHVDRQIEVLLTERHRLQLLIAKGERLKGMMTRSPALRTRLPGLERVLAHLARRGAGLDELIGRYGRHRDDLRILREAEAFSAELDAYEDSASATEPFGEFRRLTEQLDEETERMLDIADAEAELDAMLRA